MSYTGEIPDTSEKIKIFLKLILRKRRIKLTNFWKSLNRTLDISLAKFMRPENQNLVESFNEAKLVEATENLNIHKSQIIYRSATKKNMPTCGRSYKIFRTWPMERSFLNSITFFAVAGKDLSTAKLYIDTLETKKNKSFFKKWDRIGLVMELWRTPEIIFWKSLFVSFIRTHWFRFMRYE